MPVLRSPFPATEQRVSRNIYELWLGWGPRQAVFSGQESSGSVPKRGGFDIHPPTSFEHPGLARPGGLRGGHPNRRDYVERSRRRGFSGYSGGGAGERGGVVKTD